MAGRDRRGGVAARGRDRRDAHGRLLLYAPPDNVSLRALAIPMTNVPLLLLAYRHLFRPSGMTFEEGFGLEIGWARAGRLVLACWRWWQPVCGEGG